MSTESTQKVSKEKGRIPRPVEEEGDVDLTVAPWVLPREEIPVGIVVHARRPFDAILVEWDPGLELVDTINVARQEKGRRKLRITQLKSGPFDGGCYCGLVFRHRLLPSASVTFVTMKTTIVFGDKSRLEAVRITRIGRPFLELIERPERITLRSGLEAELPLGLKYHGFGDIEVRIRAKLKGKIVSHGDSLIYELVRRLLEGELTSDAADTAAKPAIEIEPAYVRKLVEAVEKLLSSETPLSSVLDAGRVLEMRKWLEDAKARRGFIDAMLTAKINQLLVSILQELLGRSPVDGITLKSARTSIDARIEAPVTRIQLEVDYRDKVGNEYVPIKAEIEVEDQTEKGEPRRVRIPITITQWTHDPILNISALRQEEGDGR